ncbi:interferon-induced protein 44-like isoform X2 [Hoplias malabaricus]|uniref:interferon-induced protein 44-like isoform X2 n=1 Tax=Hoplias malabaricus TaxID=27720 RepID=UPI0034626F8C
MASIVSSLDGEKERSIQGFFPQPVRLHLLYKSSHHRASIDTLLSRFDNHGKFVLVAVLQSGAVRGGFTSKSLNVGREFSDTEAFVFEINKEAKRFPVLNSAKAVQVHFSVSVQSDSGFTNTGVTPPSLLHSTFGAAGTTAAGTGGLFGEPINQARPPVFGAPSGFGFGNVAKVHPSTPPSPAAVSFGSSLHIYSVDQSMYVNFCGDMTYNTGWPNEKSQFCVDVELHRVQDLGDVLPSPWRNVSWTDESRQTLRESFVSYKSVVETLPRIRALLLGPVGSGKSSLINSIRSTMYRRIVHLPNVGTTTGSFTKKLTSYDIRAEQRGSPTALRLCDVMAIGDEDFTGLSLCDTLSVIKGHVPEGYQFQSDIPISDTVSGYRATPSLMDKAHCVLFVLDASKVTSYSSSLKSILRKLHTSVSDLGIPQLILLTHVDQVCDAVKEDVKNVYSSRTLREKMQKAAELVGLPLSYVLPVKNYISMLSVDRSTDILLLSVVNSVLQAVDDTLEDQYPALITETRTQSLINSNVDDEDL